MSGSLVWVRRGFLLIGMGMSLAACATSTELKTATQDLAGRTEEVRSTLDGKIEQLNKIQREAEQQQANLQRLLEQTQSELNTAQQRNAELETKVQEIKGQDLFAFQGQLEAVRRDLDSLQSGLDDQKAQVYALNQKVTGRFEATDKSLAQVTDTIKGIGTKLSGQADQQAVSLSKLEETTKQTDTQTKALSAQVAQFQEELVKFVKILNGLNDRAAEADRRNAESAGKAGMTAAPESGQPAPNLPKETKTAAIPAESSRPAAGGPPVGPQAVMSAQEMYDWAQGEYKQGRYDAALTSFHLLMMQYPQSSLAPNAHFWMAECYIKARDFERGIEEYEQVITRYPKSDKASAALYRKAIAYLELKDKEAAKIALRRLIADYPQSEDVQRARDKLASLR